MEQLMEDETLDDLQLNGLSIIQKKKAFRFGVDAVLLANFAKIKKKFRVLHSQTMHIFSSKCADIAIF